jgi:hypothetical protein
MNNSCAEVLIAVRDGGPMITLAKSTSIKRLGRGLI